MSLSGWITEFCQTHERAKQGRLATGEDDAYRAGREELAAVLLAAQRLALGGKAQTRLAIRVHQAFPVEIELPSGWVKAITLDIAVGGLSTLIEQGPSKGDLLAFRLKLSRQAEAVAGLLQVVALEDHEGTTKMSARFADLEPGDRARLEDAVFDSVVGQLRLLPKRA